MSELPKYIVTLNEFVGELTLLPISLEDKIRLMVKLYAVMNQHSDYWLLFHNEQAEKMIERTYGETTELFETEFKEIKNVH